MNIKWMLGGRDPYLPLFQDKWEAWQKLYCRDILCREIHPERQGLTWLSHRSQGPPQPQPPFPYSSKTADSQFRKTWLGVAINFPINWILCRDLGLSISVGHDWFWYISNIRDFLAYRGSAMRGGPLNILISNSSSSNSYQSIWIHLNPSILYTYTVFYHYRGTQHCCLTISRSGVWVW